MKHFVFIWLFFFSTVQAQSNRQNDSIFRPLTFGNPNEIECLYKVEKYDDSSIVLDVLKVLQAKREIFILTKKGGKISARYFVNNAKREKFYHEVSIQNNDAKHLWVALNSKNVYTFPSSEQILDSTGEPINLYVHDGVYYHFKVYANNFEREYFYHSPEAYIEELPQHSEYKDVVRMISWIYILCGVKYKY